MIFATPLAAATFLTVGALIAIYCRRRRLPSRPVGSLLLWPRGAAHGPDSRRRDRLRMPPAFWLELAALAALGFAALSPLAWRRGGGTIHVILDRSPSMAAHGGEALAHAREFLEDARRRDGADRYRVREAESDATLRRELAAAKAALAPGNGILVLTDRAPDGEKTFPGLDWRAFGRPGANCAFTACRRVRRASGEDALLLEARRFGEGPPTVALRLDRLGESTLEFDARGVARFAATLPAGTGTIRATLPDDALPSDNVLDIPPPEIPSLAVAVPVRSARRAALFRRALDATGLVSGYVEPDRADVVVTDREIDGPVAPRAYLVRFRESGSRRFSAPVWADPGAELLAGIALDGDYYTLSPEPLSGVPIAFLGEHPLIAATENSCEIAFSDSRLPFFRSPAFPALVQNALSVAARRLDGGRRPAGVELPDPGESDLTGACTTTVSVPPAIPDGARRTRSLAWVAALAAIAALFAHWRLLRRPSSLATAALAALAMLRPALPLGDRQGTIVVIADRSRSMPESALPEQRRIFAELSRTRPADGELALVTFGADAAVEQRPARKDIGETVQTVDGDGSNLAAAIERAAALVDDSRPAKLLVVSDGLFTPSGVRAPYPADTILQSRPFARDVAIARIDAPATVAPRAVVPVTAWIFADATVTNRYRLLRGTNTIAAAERVFKAGLSPLAFRDFAGSAGLQRYTLELEPAADDPCPGNNRARFAVKIEGESPLLLLRGDSPSPTAETLRAAGVPVEERAAADFPATLAALAEYDGVMLENVPAKAFAPNFPGDLAAYVADLGRGLAFTGGGQSFGAGGWCRTPVEDVLPVTLELLRDRRKYSLALAVVMDRSGSMDCRTPGGRTKMEMANLGAAAAIDLLSETDLAAVVAVDSEPHLVLALQPGDEAQANRDRILGIRPAGGGIFVQAGIMAGLRQLEAAHTAIRHLILFADADDAEEPGDFEDYLGRAAKAGISVSVIALGSKRDRDATLLQDIARLGNGECWFEQNAEEIPRLFLQDTHLAAKAVMCTNRTPLRVHRPVRQLSDTLPARLPDIGGYNPACLRDDAELAISADDEDHAPIVAFRRAGLGRTVAFAGELSGPHAAPLMTSPQGAELATALARWVRGRRPETAGGFQFERRLADGGAIITAVADEDAPMAAIANSGLELVMIKECAGRRTETFRGTLEWEAPDTLSLFAPLKDGETGFPVVILPDGTGVALPPVVQPYSAEYRRPPDPRTGERNLARLARQSGGTVRASVAGIWDSLPAVRRTLELAPLLFSAAAVWLLAAVFLRRRGQSPARRRRPRSSPSAAPPSPQLQPGSAAPPAPKPAPDGLESVFARAKRRAGTR